MNCFICAFNYVLVSDSLIASVKPCIASVKPCIASVKPFHFRLSVQVYYSPVTCNHFIPGQTIFTAK